LTLSVPIQFKRRAGRKQVTLPDGKVGKPRPWDTTATALQLAFARGHRWLAMLESGAAKSLREIASLAGVGFLPTADRRQTETHSRFWSRTLTIKQPFWSV